jgi:hypothetical protein
MKLLLFNLDGSERVASQPGHFTPFLPPPGKEKMVPSGWEAVWDPRVMWKLWRIN